MLAIAIAVGIVFAFLIVRWIVRRDIEKSRLGAKLGELVAKFLSTTALAESDPVATLFDPMDEQFATWLTTEEGATALIAANYPFREAVKDFKKFAGKHGLDPKREARRKQANRELLGAVFAAVVLCAIFLIVAHRPALQQTSAVTVPTKPTVQSLNPSGPCWDLLAKFPDGRPFQWWDLYDTVGPDAGITNQWRNQVLERVAACESNAPSAPAGTAPR